MFGKGLILYDLAGDREKSLSWACASVRDAVEYTYLCEPEWLPIAEAVDGTIVWALDANGIVRGLGREQLVYGPDVPFERWFFDQYVDLAYAWDHRAELEWAEALFEG